MHIYTVIGAKTRTWELEERVDLLITEKSGWSLDAAARHAGLEVVHDGEGFTYLCTRSHSFQIHGDKLLNYGPLVIYQDSNWDKDKVRRFLEPLELWMPGEFGQWTFAVEEPKKLACAKCGKEVTEAELEEKVCSKCGCLFGW
jgi:hypothetical protein